MHIRRLLLCACITSLLLASPAQALGTAVTAESPVGSETVQATAAQLEQVIEPDASDLSVAASQLAFPGGATTVLVATAANFPDSFASASLCGLHDAPLLLTESTTLSPAVAAEITRLGAGKVLILGGSAGVSAGVEAALEGLVGDENVSRIAGATRIETAVIVAQHVLLGSTEPTTTAFLVSSDNPNGAGLAAPAAYAMGVPILGTQAASLSAAVANFITSAGIEHVIIIGGTTEVSTTVETAVGALATAERWAGSDWPDTSLAVASNLRARGWVDADAYEVTEFADWPADIIGGMLAGVRRDAVLYGEAATGLNAATLTALDAENDAGTLERLTVVASRGTDSDSGAIVLGQIQQLLLGMDVIAPTAWDDAQEWYQSSATVHLGAADGGSGVASIQYRLDGGGLQTVAGSSATVQTSVKGRHTLVYWARDGAGNSSTQTTRSFVVGFVAVPVQGTSRIGTAIAASKLAFPDDSVDVVIIATAYNWPDALGGAALAGAMGGPILLTDPSTLPGDVMTEIRRLGASYAIILGGPAAVGQGVETALKKELGTDNVDRLAGAGRYETAQMIALATWYVLDDYDGHVFLATGANFPDALGASPLAAANGWPILLVKPGSREVDYELVATLEMMDVTDIHVLGGESAVSSWAASTIAFELQISYFPAPVTVNVSRLFGSNRYATACTVATYGVSSCGLSWDGLALATGQNFPDALAGGVLQGLDGSVMLLTPSASLDSGAKSILSTNKATIREVRFLGGTGAVQPVVRTAVANALK